jgi:hypothetical protein
MTEVLSACFTTLNGWNLPHQIKKPMSTLSDKPQLPRHLAQNSEYTLAHHTQTIKKIQYTLSPHNYMPFVQTSSASPGFLHKPICLPTIKEAKNNLAPISTLSYRKYILNKRGSSVFNFHKLKTNSQMGQSSRLFDNMNKRKTLMELNILRKTSSCLGIGYKDSLLRTMRQPKWSVPGKGL